MSELLKRVDARARLAGTNKLEILLFTLGQARSAERIETYGINVFKVREVLRTPPITRAPDMPRAVEGMASLRGMLVPVVDLATYVGVPAPVPGAVMIVTEYNGQTQGFLVEAVQNILRVEWSAMKLPPTMLACKAGGLVTAVTELADDRLVMMLDVERVLADTADAAAADVVFRSIRPLGAPTRTVLFADDSPIARKQIVATLDAMAVQHIAARNGCEAWSTLDRIATQAAAGGRPASESVSTVLTDVEMPEMDGYMLTRKIKADRRLAGIPVVMHSSLSGQCNQHLGRAIGVDEYVCKFEPQRLAETLGRLLA